MFLLITNPSSLDFIIPSFVKKQLKRHILSVIELRGKRKEVNYARL
nr:MAG TPA: hypothetical protein [Caudoviricetes sp.]